MRQFRVPLSVAALAALAVIGVIYALAGLTSIQPGEVGVLVKTLGGNQGMQERVLTTGTSWVEPFVYDVEVYDTRLKQYVLEDTVASTRDGQPIAVDVSLEIALVDKVVPQLHEDIGPNWYEAVIYPAALSALRKATGSVLSDAIYTGDGRQIVQDTATRPLRQKYEPMGIRVDVNVRDVNFTNPDFVRTLEEKAKAAQQEVIQERLAEAAAQAAIKVANTAEGQKQKRIKEAEAHREELRLAGEGQRLQKEEEAKGLLAIAQAEAEGIRLKNDAMRGAGGELLVQMAWAENLGKNVKVYAVPTGSPGTASLLDLNGVLQGAFKGAQAGK